jgi:NTE family protein
MKLHKPNLFMGDGEETDVMIDPDRRRLLRLSALGLASAIVDVSHAQENAALDRPRIGIALGAGGAAGLSHIAILEVLDEMNIRPHRISGSSIGSIVGSLYASGHKAAAIRKMAENFFFTNDARLSDRMFRTSALRLAGFVDIGMGDGGLLSSASFLDLVDKQIAAERIEDLAIPLAIVAGDLWERAEVVLRSGPLIPAISASMALPGVFQPVAIDGRVLVDGGTVNPVPYDIIAPDCDIVIAVDVIGLRSNPPDEAPGYFDTIFQSAKVMQAAIMSEKRKLSEPDIYVAPAVSDVRSLEFFRAEQVLEQAEPAKQMLRQQLESALADFGVRKQLR